MWQTLTPELITEIILQSSVREWELCLHAPCLFPWYLGHICRAWRSVFVSTPQIWANLSFDSGHFYRKTLRHFEHALSVAEMCMVWSRDHPLSFRYSVGAVHPLDPISSTTCCKLLETLIRHSTRWQDVRITLPVAESQMLYAVKNRLPALRSIQLMVTMDQSACETSTFGDLFVHTPHLRCISLDHPNYNYPSWKIDWSLITAIHHIRGSLDEVTSLLHQTTAIEELTISVTYPMVHLYNIRPVTLPSLKVLRVAALGELGFLETPSLESLSIGDLSCLSVDFTMLQSITFNFFRPLHHLKELVLRTAGEREVTMIMRNLPEVHQLSFRLRSTAYTRRTLEILSQCSQARSFREITYGEWHFGAHTLEVVSDVVTGWAGQKGGLKGIGPFENLTHFFFESPKVDLPGDRVLFLKRRFKERGILFSIKYLNEDCGSLTFGTRSLLSTY